MAAYYNETEPNAVAWLRQLIRAGLIADGEVDPRSIVDVHPVDLLGFDQCHFFAGIGGWSYALRLAGLPDDFQCWTGSCPCQPFSSASSGISTRYDDDRNLWPVWSRLIAASNPRAIFGEQVADAGDWIDVVCDDLEALDYEVGACVLPACSVGFDHARLRIYFAGHANMRSKSRRAINAEALGVPRHRDIGAELALENGLSRRMGAMRAYGNAIVPQVAAAFIEAALS